jgi:hypothetical protein
MDRRRRAIVLTAGYGLLDCSGDVVDAGLAFRPQRRSPPIPPETSMFRRLRIVTRKHKAGRLDPPRDGLARRGSESGCSKICKQKQMLIRSQARQIERRGPAARPAYRKNDKNERHRWNQRNLSAFWALPAGVGTSRPFLGGPPREGEIGRHLRNFHPALDESATLIDRGGKLGTPQHNSNQCAATMLSRHTLSFCRLERSHAAEQ